MLLLLPVALEALDGGLHAFFSLFVMAIPAERMKCFSGYRYPTLHFFYAMAGGAGLGIIRVHVMAYFAIQACFIHMNRMGKRNGWHFSELQADWVARILTIDRGNEEKNE